MAWIRPYKGYGWNKTVAKWQAKAKRTGGEKGYKHLGYFDTEAEAIEAVKQNKLKESVIPRKSFDVAKLEANLLKRGIIEPEGGPDLPEVEAGSD